MRTTAGVLGFAMLFAVPDGTSWAAIGWWALWLAAAIGLLFYGGAFKQTSTSKPTRR